MLDSVDQLDWAGITAVGVGSDIHRAMTAAYFDIDGWTVAVLGMGGVVPGEGWLADEDRPGMASGDDVEQMGAAVAAADQRADVVVVTIHWGRELVTEPDPLDRERAEAMVEAGADVVFGHHAHRLGAMEMIGDTPVFWTLGNFIWPRLSAAGAVSAVARVTLSPDGSVGACLVPVEIEESGRPRLTDGSECPEE
jgi:poly-gamma-glutamate synthesis protein (capsule biosynthesis protein)